MGYRWDHISAPLRLQDIVTIVQISFKSTWRTCQPAFSMKQYVEGQKFRCSIDTLAIIFLSMHMDYSHFNANVLLNKQQI